jgi:hypothetical protein
VVRLTAEELPRVRRSLDAGRPVVLGLVGARDLDEVARNRQVVAYGYDDDGVGTDGGPPIRRERPPYIDIGAAKGIWVNSWTPTLVGNFVAQFTARNYGEYRADLSELRLAVRGPAGENLDRFLGGDGDPTPLEPARSGRCSRPVTASARSPAATRWPPATCPSRAAGSVSPGEAGAVDEVGVTVIPPPRRARVTVTFTAVTVEDAEAVGGRLALRLAVGDQAARWPEEGAADVQDGKRFELDQRFDWRCAETWLPA